MAVRRAPGAGPEHGYGASFTLRGRAGAFVGRGGSDARGGQFTAFRGASRGAPLADATQWSTTEAAAGEGNAEHKVGVWSTK